MPLVVNSQSRLSSSKPCALDYLLNLKPQLRQPLHKVANSILQQEDSAIANSEHKKQWWDPLSLQKPIRRGSANFDSRSQCSLPYLLKVSFFVTERATAILLNLSQNAASRLFLKPVWMVAPSCDQANRLAT